MRLIEPVKTAPVIIVPDGDGEDSGDTTSVVEEQQWIPMASKPAKTVVKNLKPLSQYEVRVRAKGTKGLWCIL